ncbi:MAG: glutamate--tRNA ligase, partial [Minisyncoccia bacterium]
MVRVRFAPSPTGFLHIGSLRTCLYNYLFAKKNKGKLILRIEDTDRERFVEGAIENLIETLKSVRITWDEGPDLAEIKNSKVIIQKGKYKPYIQSQRIEIYRNLALQLINNGYAYYCFCTPGELEKVRQEQIAKNLPPRYDERCRKLTQEEILRRLRAGKPYVIRLKVPETGTIKFKDLIRGEIEFDLSLVDDQILIKS